MPNRKANLVKPSKSRDRQGFQGIQQKTNLPNLFPVGQHENVRCPKEGAFEALQDCAHPRLLRSRVRTFAHTASDVGVCG